MNERFRGFAAWTATALGSPWLFVLTSLLFVGWYGAFILGLIGEGSLLHFTLIISMVTQATAMLIQNTQTREARATQLKLDELLRSLHEARDDLIGLEHLSTDELDRLAEEFARIKQERGAHAPGVAQE